MFHHILVHLTYFSCSRFCQFYDHGRNKINPTPYSVFQIICGFLVEKLTWQFGLFFETPCINRKTDA